MYMLNGKSADKFLEKFFGTNMPGDNKHLEAPLKALETVGVNKNTVNIYEYLNVMKQYAGTWTHDEHLDVEPLRLKLEELLVPTLF